MPQFGRPSADTLIGNFTNQVGGVTDIYTTIDESSPSDADYVKSPSAPSSEVYVTKFSTLEDPVSSANHIVRYRYQKNAAAGSAINLVVQLRQGYTNEGSPGTLIKEWTHNDIANGFTTAEQTLSGGEADSITDYTDLYLRIVATQV